MQVAAIALVVVILVSAIATFTDAPWQTHVVLGWIEGFLMVAIGRLWWLSLNRCPRCKGILPRGKPSICRHCYFKLSGPPDADMPRGRASEKENEREALRALGLD